MISERLQNIILKELKLKSFGFDASLKANQVPGWDSLRHAYIIVAIEKDYKIRLKNLEILNCENLGDLQELIDSKL